MCFSLMSVAQLIVWLIVVCAVVAIIKLLVGPLLAGLGPWGGTVLQILWIVVWAVVAIAVVYLVFDLLSCVLSFPRLGR